MRLPRVRFTLRTLMAAVALVALLLAGRTWQRRAGELLKQADYHAFRRRIYEGSERASLSRAREVRESLDRYNQEWRRNEEAYRMLRPESSGEVAGANPDPIRRSLEASGAKVKALAEKALDHQEEEARAARRLADWHAGQERKYRRAAWQPWGSAAPEPDASPPW